MEASNHSYALAAMLVQDVQYFFFASWSVTLLWGKLNVLAEIVTHTFVLTRDGKNWTCYDIKRERSVDCALNFLDGVGMRL